MSGKYRLKVTIQCFAVGSIDLHLFPLAVCDDVLGGVPGEPSPAPDDWGPLGPARPPPPLADPSALPLPQRQPILRPDTRVYRQPGEYVL